MLSPYSKSYGALKRDGLFYVVGNLRKNQSGENGVNPVFILRDTCILTRDWNMLFSPKTRPFSVEPPCFAHSESNGLKDILQPTRGYFKDWKYASTP
jgi:hypothetical protein